MLDVVLLDGKILLLISYDKFADNGKDFYELNVPLDVQDCFSVFDFSRFQVVRSGPKGEKECCAKYGK